MIRAPLSLLANWLSCAPVMRDVEVRGVSTDSRRLQPGNLFVALKGTNFDGHDHLQQAAEKGAVAAVVSTRNDAVNLPQLVVPNTLQALQTLGVCWRGRVNPTVIGITGSAGKTTVKQLLAALFAQVGPTRATVGNLNNEIGVPLTLLSLADTDQFAVIELGANHVGEIARLTTLARPDFAVVTMAGSAHVGEFGSVDAIVQAKGELYVGLAPTAQALINLDSYGAEYWMAHTAAPWAGFALKGCPLAHLARWLGEYDARTATLTIFEAGQMILSCCPLPLPGAHNAVNVLAAVAVARAYGLDAAVIAAGLKAFSPPMGRMGLIALEETIALIDDTYNANPESMRAALDYLVSRPGVRVAVLGDMGELGAQSASLHQALGDHARSLPLDAVFTLGEAMLDLVARCSLPTTSCVSRACVTPEEITALLSPYLAQSRQSGTPLTILFKGSRFMQMERVMRLLQSQNQTEGAL
ncbi:MAG TPA: UDP-N-acetylmuramoyl-tripeptide--D-alanyl-D-alanine ligase [Halothiobacillus sp.]|nr:UDP-N-acetylmuramoyl-tripeptide--D-alanyl-D-alanine ligase [Halothiobacillus sp.]